MLYTIMPLEAVMEGQESNLPTYTEMLCKNGTLIVEALSMNSARVVRLISSDPMDYLNPSMQPGSIINFKAESQAT